MSTTRPIVLLTGASYGLGPVIAERFARGGFPGVQETPILILVARTVAGLVQTAASVERLGARADVFVADLRVPAQRAAIVEHIAFTYGRLDVFVSNAALSPFRLFEESSWPEIDESLQVNLIAPMALARGVLPMMQTRRRGSIVIVSSMAGKFGLPFNATYSACKGALVQWTRAMRSELRGTGVHVAVVCPTSASDVGVSARSGQAAPWTVGTVTPGDIAEAVYRSAAGRGRFEQIVSRMPFRPFLALSELFPEAGVWLVRAFGISRMYAAAGTPSRPVD